MTLQQVVYERPPEGLARGRIPVPWWVIAAIAAVVIVSAIVFLVVRAWAAARAAKGPAAPPGP